MRTIQNPFSIYDFLGYLVPGIILAIGVIVTSSFDQISPDLQTFLKKAFSGISIELYLPALIICYLAGHLVSYLSSITVERYSVWTIGYPSAYMLKRKPESYFHSEDKGIIRIITIAKRLFIAIFLLPIVTLDLLLGILLRFRKQQAKVLDDHLIATVEASIKPIIDVVIDKANTNQQHDFFRIVYHYVLEKCSNHVPKMQNYVALYGFLRTTCLIFVVFSWILLYNAIRSGTFVRFTFPIVLVSLTSYILYLDFNKFYRKFSLEVFMAASAIVLRNSV